MGCGKAHCTTKIQWFNDCETCSKSRRKTGNKPKTWMLKMVRRNTSVVLVRRDASTVEPMIAALVERESGNLRGFRLIPYVRAEGMMVERGDFGRPHLDGHGKGEERRRRRRVKWRRGSE